MSGETSGIRPGRVFADRYVALDRLGIGGFGTVWRALDQVTQREVAIKVLHPLDHLAPADVAQVTTRFLAEGEILEQLDHPNIVRPLARFADGGSLCLVTELVRGAALADAILARTTARVELRLDEVMAVVDPLAQAIDHAHARGVVHRDLKPRNIMLVDEGGRLDARVLDFGVARLVNTSEADATTVGRLVGTLLYMSPEQFRSPRVGPAADQFALASILYEMLTQHWAWARDERGEPLTIERSLRQSDANGYATLLERITRGRRPEVTALRPDLPPVIDEILARAWAEQPEDRHASVGAFAAEVRAALLPVVHDRTRVDEPRTALTLLRSAEKEVTATVLTSEVPVLDGLLATPTVSASSGGAAPLHAATRGVPTWLGLTMAVTIATATALVGLAIVRAVKHREPELVRVGGVGGRTAEPRANAVADGVRATAAAPTIVPAEAPEVVTHVDPEVSATPAPSARPSASAPSAMSARPATPAPSAPPAPTARPAPSATPPPARAAARPIPHAADPSAARPTEEAEVEVFVPSAATASVRALMTRLDAAYDAATFRDLIRELRAHPQVAADPARRARVNRAASVEISAALPILRALVAELH